MTEQYSLITDAGEVIQAAALANGVSVNITHFVVGDGGGTEQTPDPSRTKLVNEKYRGEITEANIFPEEEDQIVFY